MTKNSGKAPSVQFYYKDFMADMEEHPAEIVGAWIKLLCKIWHENDQGEITRTIEQYGRIFNTPIDEATNIVKYFSEEKIATVTHRNGKITVVNRRFQRDCKLKEQNRLRQSRHRRNTGLYGDSNASVTPMLHHPSSSSSSSSSTSKERESARESEKSDNFDQIVEAQFPPQAETPEPMEPMSDDVREICEAWATACKRPGIHCIPAKDFEAMTQKLPILLRGCSKAEILSIIKKTTRVSAGWWLQDISKLLEKRPKRTEAQKETPDEYNARLDAQRKKDQSQMASPETRKAFLANKDKNLRPTQTNAKG